MKRLIVAALAAVALSGCVAVPAPYYPGEAYYYPGPAVGVGVYAAPAYPYYRNPRHYHRHRW